MADAPHKTEDGLPKVYPSCRPHGTTTYFTGAGDHPVNGVGQGNKLLFKLGVNDPSQKVDLTFNEDVYIKDGYMIARGAPFGASVDIEVYHPGLQKVVSCFGKAIPILDNGWFPLDTEDRSLMPAGLMLRITCRNADGVDNAEGSAEFVMAGRIEMYRKTTV